MTPEQTLDWLAQQHFDQCREERLIQDWIRKMKSQLPAQPEQSTTCGEPVAYITPLMEQQMFDDWCPYKGNPDPRVVWAGAIEAVNGLLLGATPTQRKPLTDVNG